ncbi:unnamed protein product [uncultured virus]|nr:unnamed protein product [uncultured virus]
MSAWNFTILAKKTIIAKFAQYEKVWKRYEKDAMDVADVAGVARNEALMK